MKCLNLLEPRSKISDLQHEMKSGLGEVLQRKHSPLLRYC